MNKNIYMIITLVFISLLLNFISAATKTKETSKKPSDPNDNKGTDIILYFDVGKVEVFITLI
jgi:hypothetical protein